MSMHLVTNLLLGACVVLVTLVGALGYQNHRTEQKLTEYAQDLRQCELDLSAEQVSTAMLEEEVTRQNAEVSKMKMDAARRERELKTELERGREVIANAQKEIDRLNAQAPENLEQVTAEVVEWVESL